ncbi:MAG TPA: response regulator transcription factor [Dehalococcoidia bacterium]|nr:response regulator transcription factor [Dehalococcoidia bacterium]
MRLSAEVQTASSAVATRAAFVVADAELWSPALESALRDAGLSATAASELHELFQACSGQRIALVVLAKRNARFAVKACRALRGLQGVPILVVMPRESDLVPVLDAGADDAVVARVDPAVLTARVRALLRRVQQEAAPRGLVVIRDLEIDLDKFQAVLGGRPVPLTPTEFRLLAVLAQRAGRVIDARALLAAVNNNDYSERDAQSLVKVHIANLRRKLNDSGAQNPYILCVRGFGYMLERRAQRREDDPLADLIDDNEDPA